MASTSPFRITHPFAPRDVHPAGVQHEAGYALKAYDVTLPTEELHESVYAEGQKLALPTLPQPAVTLSRPGIAIVIRHQGRDWDYFVLAWWDGENELPIRVFTRPRSPQGLWQPGSAQQSVCVWDLEILAFERDAYVRHMMGPDGPDPSAYLARQLRVTGSGAGQPPKMP